MVCAGAPRPTQRRSDWIVFYLVRDLSNRGRKLPRTRCRIDRPVHAWPILFFFPNRDWCCIHRRGEEATHFSARNVEARMTNDEESPNAQMTKQTKRPLRHSDFVIPSSLGIRHSSLRNISFVSAKARYYLSR